MDFILPLAAKSLLIAGITLLVLKAMHRRSAADRSLIAHLGLAAIAILPLAWLLLPQVEVATSLPLGHSSPWRMYLESRSAWSPQPSRQHNGNARKAKADRPEATSRAGARSAPRARVHPQVQNR